MKKILNLILFIAGLLPFSVSASPPILLPKDSGYVDVTQEPYLAVPDGKTDCTEALQMALDRDRNIYLPPGTYLVSDIVHFGLKEASCKRKVIQGAGIGHTTIRLKDTAPGYQDPQKPKEVIRCANREDLEGAANAFRNGVHDLTIDVGRGNAGAIGIFYYAHNQGTMDNVRIISPDPGSGWVGLDQYRGLSGPCLQRNIEIEGFQYGIRVRGPVRQLTYENITLKNQKRFGVYNNGNVVNFRKVTSTNSVPAFHNRDPEGVITVVEADLNGGDAAGPAFDNANGFLYLRDIKTSGYGMAVRSTRGNVPAGEVKEYSSHGEFALFPSPKSSLRLPIEETPESTWDSLDKWAAVSVKPVIEKYKDSKGKSRIREDFSEAIQKAIDSGAETVYFPSLADEKRAKNIESDLYGVYKPVILRGKVKRLFVGDNTIDARCFPWLIIADGDAATVVVERMGSHYGKAADKENPYEEDPAVLIDTERTVVIRNVTLNTHVGIKVTDKPGKVFLEDYCGGGNLMGKKKVWARQVDPENPHFRYVTEGGTLWIMGLKTERGGTIIEARGGAKVELLGGMLYGTTGVKKMPAFVVENSSLFVSIAESTHNGYPFETLVSETRGDETRTLKHEQLWQRDGYGMVLPFFSGWIGENAVEPSLPDVKASSPWIENLVIYQDPPAKEGQQGQWQRWALHHNLQEDCIMQATRQFVIERLPEELKGADWLKVNMDHYKTVPAGEPAVKFQATVDLVVYVTKEWAGWEKMTQGMDWVYSDNWPVRSAVKAPDVFTAKAEKLIKTDPLFRKVFKKGEQVEIPPGSILIAFRPATAQAWP